MQVRVRRDADEQMVLAHVYNRLSNLVTYLTVQIFKDDWTRASSRTLLGNSPFPAGYPSSPPGSGGPSRTTSPVYDIGHMTGGGLRPMPPVPPSVSPFEVQGRMQKSHDFKTSTPLKGSSYSPPSSYSTGYNVN